jgi:ELWxxDGT repeat protein
MRPWRRRPTNPVMSSALRLEALEDRRLLALGPEFLKDVNDMGLSSTSSMGPSAGTLENVMYFRADDATHGIELWRSDGTFDGTWMVKDLVPGGNGSHPRHFTAVGDLMFFVAGYEYDRKDELWVTDGTSEGTIQLKKFNFSLGDDPGILIADGYLYFTAENDIWRSNGAANGTSMFLSQASTRLAVEQDGTLYHLGNGQLRSTDIATRLTESISICGSDRITDMRAVGDRFYLACGYSKLWTSDGTAQGTHFVEDVYPGYNGEAINYLTEYRGELYFEGRTAAGTGLWKSDGTPAGTFQVFAMDIGLRYEDESITVFNDLLMLPGRIGQQFGFWKSDGTVAGTTLVMPDESGPFGQGATPSVAEFQGKLFFAMRSLETGSELWTTDLTPEGTHVVRDVAPGKAESWLTTVIAADDQIFFFPREPRYGMEPWTSDGTESGTRLIRDIQPETYAGEASEFISLGDELIFVGHGGQFNREPWRTDGTSAGTAMIRDVRRGDTLGSNPYQLTRAGDFVFFMAHTPLGIELCRTDGTYAGTRVVRDLTPGNAHSNLQLVGGAGENLYFHPRYPSPGGAVELWRSDGSEAGTTRVKEFASFSGEGFAFFRHLTDVNGAAFFTFEDPVHGRELWRTDGTEAGTFLVKDIFPGGGSGTLDNHPYTSKMVSLNGILYFTANDDVHGRELWRSDGTADGTWMVTDLREGPTSSYAGQLTVWNNQVYFSADDGQYGSELWRTDGTAEGTVRVTDIVSGAEGSSPRQLTAAGDSLYFIASDGAIDEELWRTDGTVAGTWQVGDVRPGPMSSGPQQITPVGDLVYFTADDGNHGVQIWRTAGTPETTVMVAPYAFPGLDDAEPALPWTEANHLNAVGDHLVFTGIHSVYDRELWVVNHSVTSNVAPVLDASPDVALEAIDEDEVSNNGTRVADLVRNGAGSVVVTDADAGQFIGIAVTAVDNANGRWQFTQDDGTAWFDFGNASESSARLLLADYRTRVRFVPNANFYGDIPTGITFRAWDGTQGVSGGIADASVAGGTTAFSAALETASIAVQEVNDAPIANDDFAVMRQGQVGVSIDVLSNDSSGPDVNEQLRIIAVTQPAVGTVELLSETGPIAFTVADDVFGVFTFHYTLDDGRGGMVEGNVEVVVSPPGDANVDGAVDLTDLNLVRNHFGETGDSPGDTNGDGVVDLTDLNAVRNNFGADAPPESPSRTTSRAEAPSKDRQTSESPVTIAQSASRQDVLFQSGDSQARSARYALAWRRLKAVDQIFDSF